MPTPRTRISALLAASALTLVAACGDDGAGSVSFAEPNDGDAIAGSVEVAMTADGITIEPAGEVNGDAGHFHVIADAGCLEPGEGVPKDADHVHFGKGQAEGSISLEPGPHELCLQVGDGAHVALAATDTVSLTVGVTSQEEWCSTIGEVDDLFEQGDSGLDFADAKIIYENTRRLLAQLDEAVDVVEADVRGDLAETIDFASEFTTVLANAESPAEAEAELEQIFASLPDDETLPGSDWILDACGVDVED